MTSLPPAAPTSADEAVETRVRVRLYVAGESPNSVAALSNLRSALAGYPGHGVALELVDVFQTPERCLRDGVLVTPMLVRVEPGPERRVLGSLTDRAALLGLLGIDSP